MSAGALGDTWVTSGNSAQPEQVHTELAQEQKILKFPTHPHLYWEGGVKLPADSSLSAVDNVVAGINGACPAPSISPSEHLLIGAGVPGSHPSQNQLSN